MAASNFPTVRRDLSIVVPERLPMAYVQTIAHQNGHNLISIELFDEFRDAEKIGVGQKNLAFHLVFQSKDSTLTAQQVDQEFKHITQQLNLELGAKLRVDFEVGSA